MELIGADSREFGAILNTVSRWDLTWLGENTEHSFFSRSRVRSTDGSATGTESTMRFADRDRLSAVCFPLSESSQPGRASEFPERESPRDPDHP
jgi:hypothetical protein